MTAGAGVLTKSIGQDPASVEDIASCSGQEPVTAGGDVIALRG